ncbi:MAG: hypothetical protein FWH57_09560 [Oscillospiraceae bacterium]|nr:hypothetical protein [Oscillospiraceae bacterium]
MKYLSRMISIVLIICPIVSIFLFTRVGAQTPSINQASALEMNHLSEGYRLATVEQNSPDLDLAVDLGELVKPETIDIESGKKISLQIDILRKESDDNQAQTLGALAACYKKEIYTSDNPLDAATDIYLNLEFYEEGDEQLDLYCEGFLLRNSSAIDISILPGTAYYINETAGVAIALPEVTASDVFFTFDPLVLETIEQYGQIDIGAVQFDIMPNYMASAHLITSAENYSRRDSADSTLENPNLVRSGFNDTLRITAEVYNTGGIGITDAYLNVTLPDGVVYQSGTTRVNNEPWYDSLRGGSLQLPELRVGDVYRVQFIVELDVPVSSYERVLTTPITLLYAQENYASSYIVAQIEPDEIYSRKAVYNTKMPIILSLCTALLSLVGFIAPKIIETIPEGVKRQHANKILLYTGYSLLVLFVGLLLPLMFPGSLRIWPWMQIASK